VLHVDWQISCSHANLQSSQSFQPLEETQLTCLKRYLIVSTQRRSNPAQTCTCRHRIPSTGKQAPEATYTSFPAILDFDKLWKPALPSGVLKLFCSIQRFPCHDSHNILYYVNQYQCHRMTDVKLTSLIRDICLPTHQHRWRTR
jgi:hypothetical protein